MKTRIILLITITLTILNLKAFAQGVGSINFANAAANPVRLSNGTLVPRGAAGGTYIAELRSALDGADFSTATRQGLTTTFNSPQAGVFLGGGRTVPTTQNGGFGQFQVRVWDSRAGATYEQAASLSFCSPFLYEAGQTGVFRTDTADASSPTPPTPAPLGMPTFYLFYCPEPSTYALFVLGAGALWLFRRRK